MLSVKKLSFSYGDRAVLRDVSFDVRDGEIAAVLGVNGAGKSTLLKCLDRILKHDGDVFLDGHSTKGLPRGELARLMGYVPQKISFARGSVFDAVLLGRLPYIKWEAAARDLEIVGEVLERLSLSALSQRDVSELSGGEQQKVAVARALAQQPRVLLFDEPTCNLDLKNSLETLKILRTVASLGISVVVSLHDLNLALRFADKLIFLKDNLLFASGDASCVSSELIREVYGVEAEIHEIREQRVVLPLE